MTTEEAFALAEILRERLEKGSVSQRLTMANEETPLVKGFVYLADLCADLALENARLIQEKRDRQADSMSMGEPG